MKEKEECRSRTASSCFDFACFRSSAGASASFCVLISLLVFKRAIRPAHTRNPGRHLAPLTGSLFRLGGHGYRAANYYAHGAGERTFMPQAASSHRRLSLSLKSDFKRRHNWQCATCENVECNFVCLLLLFLWMLEARTSGSVLTHCSWKIDQPSLGDCYQFQCKPCKVCLQLDTRAVPLFIPIHLHCRVPQTQVSSKKSKKSKNESQLEEPLYEVQNGTSNLQWQLLFFFFLIAVAVILCTGQKPEQNLDRCSRSLPTFPIFPRDFRCPLPVSSPCHTFFSWFMTTFLPLRDNILNLLSPTSAFSTWTTLQACKVIHVMQV